MFLYNIGAYLMPTAENLRELKYASTLAIWSSNTYTIEIERHTETDVNIL